MHFQVNDPSQIGDELRRICLELMNDSRAVLENWETDPATSIHELRKNMKKIRATLRLVQKVVPSRDMARLVRLIHEVKDHYGPTRDEEIMRTMLLEVAGNDVVDLANTLFRSATGSPYPPPVQFFERVDCLTKKIAALSFADVTISVVRSAYLRTLKRGKAAMKKCITKGGRLCFHRWRKRMKDGWYQSEILSAIEDLETAAGIAKEASEYLGEGNDLCNLKLRLKKVQSDDMPEWVIKDVQRSLKRSRTRALWLGEKFYQIGKWEVE